MQRRRTFIGAGLAALLLTSFMVGPGGAGAASDFTEPDILTLNNATTDENYVTGEGACENDPALDPTTSYWHLVLAPNSGFTFQEIHLNVGGTVSSYTWVQNGEQADNVFVAVPDGAELTDLITTGSYALIDPDTTETTGEKMNFNLSHTCTGTPDEERTPPAISVTKTAVGSWARTWGWTVDKELVGIEPVILSGVLHAAITYSVDVESYVASDVHGVTGDITVSNGNDEPATITSVLDQLPGFDCTLDEDITGDVVTATSGDVTVGYSCSPSDGAFVPGGEYTNSATVGWSWAEGTGSKDATAAFSFPIAPNPETDETATVLDDKYGDLTGDTTYTVTVPVTAGTCTDGYTNTVTVTGDDSGSLLDEDSVVVHLCSTVGGRTIGFWSNKNGAALATKAPVQWTTLDATYPNVLGIAPFTGTDYSKVQKFLTASTTNCTGDCMSMLRAQFFAAAMNSIYLDGYAAEKITQPAFMGGGCVTMAQFLVNINAGNPSTWTTAERTEVKSLLDKLNQDVPNMLQCV